MPVSLRARSAPTLLLTFTFTLILTLVVTLFAGTPEAQAASRRQEKTWDALRVVRHQKGDPYQYGSAGPGAFDCSGLTYFSYRRAGFRNMPRVSRDQARFTNRIRRRQMRRGDLVFFYDGRARARNVYHVAVFTGWKNGRRRIIHSPRPGSRVHSTRGLWTNKWFAGTLRFR